MPVQARTNQAAKMLGMFQRAAGSIDVLEQIPKGPLCHLVHLLNSSGHLEAILPRSILRTCLCLEAACLSFDGGSMVPSPLWHIVSFDPFPEIGKSSGRLDPCSSCGLLGSVVSPFRIWDWVNVPAFGKDGFGWDYGH